MIKRKKSFVVIFISMLVFTLVLSACGQNEQSAKELLTKGVAASAEMESFRFEGGVGFQLSLPPSLLESDPVGASVAQFMENVRVDIDGVYHRDPLQMEANLNLHLTGDMALTLTVPFVMTEETLWVRIPQIPLFPLPPDATGKFLQLDFEDLAQLDAGASSLQTQMLDISKQQEFGMQVLDTFVRHFDEENYFTLLSAEEIKSQLPNRDDVKQVVQFTIDNDQWKEAASILINDVLPDFVELISEPEWFQWLEIDASEIEQMKEDLEQGQEEWKENMNELDEHFKLNSFVMQMGLNDKDYTVNSQMFIDMEIYESGEEMPIVIDMEMNYDEINENPSFEIGIPNEEDTLTTDQLMQMFMPSF